jgi:hypothetical protein
MSTYRFLQDHYDANGLYYQAGTTASTQDVGGSLPTGWVPTGQVDPLDTAAVNAFWAAGPMLCGAIKTQWSNLAVAAPVTRWTDSHSQPLPRVCPKRSRDRPADEADAVRRNAALATRAGGAAN